MPSYNIEQKMNNVKSYFSQYTIKTSENILQELQTSQTQGLSDAQVIQLHKKFGNNEIKTEETGWLPILIRQFKSPFIYMLLFVAALSLILQNHFDAIVIMAIVVLNTLFGFYQEYKASKTLELLKQYIVSSATVIRDGKEVQILSKDLVPGDIVVLLPGDAIPAEVRFIETQNITVDESALTGESQSIKKQHEPLDKIQSDIFAAYNIGFWGTTILTGKAIAVVIAIGNNTTLGDISQLTAQTVRISSFEKGISKFSSFILWLMIISLVVVFCANLIIKKGNVDVIELILFAAALSLSVIPEALPIITTFALSQGALRLARKKAVVKRLSAIEDLGNIQILCTDKTGTLTENVSKIEAVYGKNEREIVVDTALMISVSEKKLAQIKGYDLALYTYLTPQEIEYIKATKHIADIPFDPNRRSSAVVIQKNNSYFLIVRGSVEDVLKACINISPDEIQKINSWLAEQEVIGRRVLAVASKELPVANATTSDYIKEEHSLQFQGMVSFGDPIKKTAFQAIKKAQILNVEIKILSGDTRQVCITVATQVGLIKDPSQVMTGEEFAQLSPAEKFEKAKSMVVFARVSPQQKYEIISLLQQEKEVAYMGDGINDAPALKIANVALAVQDAAGIAREASDIILLKKSLLVVIDGIEEGRIIFANTLKYIRTTLSCAFGNFYAIAIAYLMLPYLPILPVQLLLLNFMSDSPMLAIATDTMSPAELKRPERYDIKGILILVTILGIVSTLFDLIFFTVFNQYQPPVLQTAWFIGSLLTELVFFFSVRTSQVFYKASRPSWQLITLMVLVGAATMILPYLEIGQRLFYFVPLKPIYMIWIIFITIAYFFTTEFVKVIYYRLYNNGNNK